MYVAFYALWLQRGYQEFAQVESSITVKIKGVTKSHLDNSSKENHGKTSHLLFIHCIHLTLGTNWNLVNLC